MILLTDGSQTKPTGEGSYTPLDVASAPLKEKHIRIVTVGVGDVSDEEMYVLAPDARNRFKPKTFGELLPLVDQIIESSVCEGRTLQRSRSAGVTRTDVRN